MLLSVDPGADAGWALFEEDTLVRCGLEPRACPIHGVTRLVVERPRIYPDGRQKARPDDIIKLAMKAGEWGGFFLARDGYPRIDPEYITPQDWKGQVSKETSHKRVLMKLSLGEGIVFGEACDGVAAGKRHNILDAIGIGLWVVGR